MIYVKKIAVWLLLAGLVLPLIVQAAVVNEHIIESKAMAEQQNITVYLPDDYHKYPDDRYPVFYFLDGQYYKDMVQGVLSAYYENGLAPDMILVAIENQDRVRDYTPSMHEIYKQGGGSETFLDYVEKELIPFVEANYQTSDFRALNGHSLGGLLTLHSMHSRPGLFTAYLAMSPSLYQVH